VTLTEAESARFARQLILPGFSPGAQECLRGAQVHVVGAGSVAGPAMLYLAMAGVGSLLVDDTVDVAPGDAEGWLHVASRTGQSRALSAIEALGAASSLSRACPFGTGSAPSATLVCAESAGVAREAAERARQAGIPHVVAGADGDGGEVVSIPVGSPCYACAARPGRGLAPQPGASAALGALAALELLQLLLGLTVGPAGRRLSLTSGRPEALPTTRLPGCTCGGGLR